MSCSFFDSPKGVPLFMTPTPAVIRGRAWCDASKMKELMEALFDKMDQQNEQLPERMERWNEQLQFLMQQQSDRVDGITQKQETN